MSNPIQDLAISLDINLSDLPKGRIRKCSDGKLRIYMTVAPRKEPDAFGNNVTAYVTQTKEERTEKQPKEYVGAGKVFSFRHDEIASEDDFKTLNWED